MVIRGDIITLVLLKFKLNGSIYVIYYILMYRLGFDNALYKSDHPASWVELISEAGGKNDWTCLVKRERTVYVVVLAQQS